MTVEELEVKVIFLYDHLGLSYEDPPPPPSGYTLPEYRGTLISSATEDVYPLPYTPYSIVDSFYRLWVQKGNAIVQLMGATPTNYTQHIMPLNSPRGTIIRVGNQWYCAYHKWFGSRSYYYFAMTPPNSNVFTDVATIREPYGEDITFIADPDVSGHIFRAFCRPRVPALGVRTIAYMSSSDFRNWTTPREILVPDTADSILGHEFYSMSVVSTPRGYFGFLNVYDRHEDEVHTQLVYAPTPAMNFRRLYSKREILPRAPMVKQTYACASLIGDTIYIPTIQAEFRHDESDRNGRYYYTSLYQISLNNLYRFLT